MEKVLKYTENEVNFDSVKIPQILYEHGPLGRKGKIEYNDDEVTHIDSKPFINAVDIDWNGIEIENNNRINTTADLINWIKSRSIGSSEGSLPVTISLPITCYRWYHKDDLPIVPTENSEEPTKNDTYEAIPESKWSKYAINRPEGNDWVLYLCSGTKEGKSYLWQSVTRISGIDGSVGEDSKDREWIYKVFNEELTFSFDNYNPNNWDAVQQDDYVGPNGWLWFDNPQGVSKENRFEYASYRDYKNKLWTKFSTPILWSHYGVNGIDGDGVEYCYVRTVSKEAPEVVVNNIENELTDEYKPLVKIESLAGYNNTKLDIKGEGEYYQNDGYSYTRCTDDPKGVDGTFQYEWVIVRKKDEPNDNGTRKWKRYSGQMSLWSSFTVNVDPAITIKDGFLWGDGDYIKDGDGNPIKIEGGDGSQGVETIGCPDENKTYKPGTISVCENKVKIYYNDQWIDFGESSGSGNYLHVAYAQDINFTDYTYKGFTTTNTNQQTYPWIGLLTDDKIDDTNLEPDYPRGDQSGNPDSDEWQNFIKYKWNYIKGRDGNGVEYIFLLTKEEVTKPGIDENTYVDNEGVSHNKQDDEFLPKVKDYNTNYQSEYWTDDPQQGVSAKWPKLWKAIRKKVNGNWRDFYPPKIENLYFPPNSLYSIVTTNDTIVIDDLTVLSKDIENASLGELSLYYNSEIVEDGVTWSISSYNLPTGIIFDNIKEEENSIVFKSNTFKLKRNDEVPVERFDTGQFYFYVLAKVNNSPEAEKKIGLIIKDISGDGSFYKLIILNDSLSYNSRGGSNNNQNPIVNIKKIRNGQAQEVTLNNIIYDVSDIDKYNLTGLTLLFPNNIQYKLGNNYTTDPNTNDNDPINLPVELGSIGYQSGGYEITLYYNDEIVDSEHIDCIKDGADGVVSAYIITSDNDNILLDDLSTSIANLESASSGTLNLIYNNTPVISDDNKLIWECGNNNLSLLGLEVYIDNNSFKLKYSEGNTPPEKFPVSTELQLYYFKIRANLNNKIVALKQFNIIIKDISIDGSFYRLVILNDSQSYKSDETPNNNSNPIISVHKIKDGKSEQITKGIKLINDADITTSLSEKSGITLVIPNKLYEVNNNSTLPLTLTNGVVYNEGGYDIALYYNKELLGAEHINCIKDGKDASISDGITIKDTTRFYQANSDGTYPNPHVDDVNAESGNWKREQSDTNWNASNPYLFIQDYTAYNNGHSWGKVELYSYWGNENYDLVVSPLHIILDEKVDEENEDRSYLGTNTVTVTLYKSGTEDSIIPTIPQCKFYFIKDSNPYNLTQIERNINTKTTTITINTNKSNGSSMYSIEEYLSDKDNSISEGYLSFTVEGYEVYDENKTDNTSVFIRQVKVPVYINRVESTLFKVKRELENFVASETQGIVNGLDDTYVLKKTYNTDIEATEKKLRSEYTEIIKRAGDYNPNLFGFHKDVKFGCFVPFILGYGIAIPESLWIKDKGEYYGYIKNLGFDGVGGLFTISFKARTFQSNTSQSNTSQSNNVEFIFWTNKKCSNANTVNINNSWQEYTLEYNLDLDVTDVTDTNGKNSIPKGELQIRTSNNNFDLYIRELKIERGNIKTLFCEAEEDLSYFDDKQLISNLSFNSDYISYSSDTEVENKTGVYYTSKDIIANNLTNDFVDLLYQNTSFNIKAGCIYTLSYWAKFSNTNEVYITSYLLDSANNLIQDIANNIYIPGNSGSIIAGVKSNGETFVRLSNEWKHYFIRFYATNSINNANLIVARYFKKKFNSNVSLNGSGQLYISDIKFQEGYVVEPNYYGSLVEQTARGISLFQQTGLKKTGIDISTGNITVQADQFTIINSSGQKNMSVNESGDVEFSGVIKGTYNLKVQIYSNSGSDTIKSDTDYYMFNGSSSSGQSAKMPNPKDCPGRVINISKNNRPTQNGVLLQNYDLEIPFIWYDNIETPSIGPIDFYYYQKVVLWSDPSLFARGFGWRVIESIQY